MTSCSKFTWPVEKTFETFNRGTYAHFTVYNALNLNQHRERVKQALLMTISYPQFLKAVYQSTLRTAQLSFLSW